MSSLLLEVCVFTPVLHSCSYFSDMSATVLLINSIGAQNTSDLFADDASQGFVLGLSDRMET